MRFLSSSVSYAFLLGLNVCLLLCFPDQVEGHGYLKTPRSRNFVAFEDGIYWPLLEENPKKEDCPHCLNLGGTLAQCGLTGSNNYDFPKNSRGGPMDTNIQATYAQGETITVDVVLTAHHRGHFSFYACPMDPNSSDAHEGTCFDQYPLEYVSDLLYAAPKDPNYPNRAYIAPSNFPGAVFDTSGVSGMLFTFQFKLPDELVGQFILLQWHYLTANSCAHPGYEEYAWPDLSWKPTNMAFCGTISPYGAGVPEQFWNCAEIRIDNTSPTTSPVTPAPSVSVVPSIAPQRVLPTALPTTLSPTTVSPTPPPVPTVGTCGSGNIGNGVCADPVLCCSEWGWCGTTAEHCADRPPTPPPVDGPTPPPVDGPDTEHHDDSRLLAYLGNWQPCPTVDQYAQYTHIVIAFAVTYTWNPSKNVCSETCEIAEPPICNNSPNPALVSAWQATGKKVILSFGGAGMGGSWQGDNNDCWEYCFGRETQVVTRLTEIVDNMGLDGIDIDYEYFYEGRPDVIHFLREVTLGMRNSLEPGAIVTHAPMEPDVAQGTAYFNLFVELAPALDFVMPQYYNGNTRPATDGFFGGAVSAEAHYTAIVNQIFGGDATKIIFGFCITGCLGSASGAQAANVMSQIETQYECNGGAYFWVVNDDVGGAWSRAVSAVVAPNRGCSAPPTTSAPTEPTPPTTESPTPQPVVSPTSQPTIPPTKSPTPPPVTPAPTISPAPTEPWSMCCPSGYTGLKASGDCGSYYHCVGGVVTGSLLACSAGTLFDESLQFCNWENQVTCTIAPCNTPTSAPTTPSISPAPTEPWSMCCPAGYTGLKAYGDCYSFYHCVGGVVTGSLFACSAGTLFDESIQNYNLANQVICTISSCNDGSPTAAPTPPSTGYAYPAGFCQSSPFQLNGNQLPTYPMHLDSSQGCALMLTSDAARNTASSAFVPIAIGSDLAFSTSFEYRLYGSGAAGNGDGMAFVIHQDSRREFALGTDGSALGVYGGYPSQINPAIVIAFDIHNGDVLDSRNHVRLQLSKTDGTTEELAAASRIIATATDVTGRLWVTYDGSYLTVTHDNPSEYQFLMPIINTAVSLDGFFDPDQPVYAGFTAGTGLGTEYQEILSWSITTENITPAPTVAPTAAPTAAPTPSDGSGVSGDPIILGLQNQVFKFQGRNGAWYSNLSNKYFQWNMQFKQFDSCPQDENMFVSGIALSMRDQEKSNILIATTPEAIPECRENPNKVCLGEGTLHISFDGGRTFISEPGNHHFGSYNRVVAHNTYAACSRKWHDYDVSRTDWRRLRLTIQEKKPLQLLSDNKAKMIDQAECSDWIKNRMKNDDLFQQKGQWSTLYIETNHVAFHVEYRRSDWYHRKCDFQSLDAWMTKVSDIIHGAEWDGILGETRYKVYDKTTGEQITTDRHQLLRSKTDADYEVDGPFGTKFAARTVVASSSKMENVFDKVTFSLVSKNNDPKVTT